MRYRQVDFYLEKQSFDASIEKYNYYSFIVGIIAALGVCVVANFQESNILIAHLLGAVAAFGLGSVYAVLQVNRHFQMKRNLIKIFFILDIHFFSVVSSFWEQIN